MRLRKLFTEGFRALDIAEPLPSFDAEGEMASARRVMKELGCGVAGVRVSGHVRGYLLTEDAGAGACSDGMRPFAPGQVLTDEAGLHEAIRVLDSERLCFIATLGTVDAVVTRDDVQKPAARMWLFGNVTLIEMIMTAAIARRYPDEAWKERISEGRLGKAGELLSERERRGQRVSLLDCLQLSDKARILMRDPEVLKDAEFPSRNAAAETMKRLESLRNSLAHAQQILPEDWPVIARLAYRLDRLLSRLTEPSE